jgi:hypothetical protein
MNITIPMCDQVDDLTWFVPDLGGTDDGVGEY